MNISKFAVSAAMTLATIGSALAGNLILVGDSTLAPRKPDVRIGSWGDAMSGDLVEGWTIYNCAIGGKTVKSIQEEKGKSAWEKALAKMQKGDFVIVQFGINDASKKKLVEIPEFKAEFGKFADAIREKGATPIFCSPVTACRYGKDGKFSQTESRVTYGNAIKEVAAEKKVEFVDMTALTTEILTPLNKEEGLDLYGGRKVKDGKKTCDVNHPSKKGASAYGKAFIKDVKSRNLSIAKIFK